jgi:hypothetical protein
MPMSGQAVAADENKADFPPVAGFDVLIRGRSSQI